MKCGETILSFAEIGIILLLFLVGLELSPRRLWVMRRDILLFGPLQVALCGLAMFGVILVVQPSFSWEAALVLGAEVDSGHRLSMGLRLWKGLTNLDRAEGAAISTATIWQLSMAYTLHDARSAL